jgi:dipeptidyl aminopeptidase/acylaminoacyl peptidase
VAGIKANIEKEAGTSPEAFAARSPLLADPPIRVPVLILHGEQDESSPIEQARQLAARLRAAGTPVTLAVFPDTGHGIPSGLSAAAEQAFLEQTVGGTRER